MHPSLRSIIERLYFARILSTLSRCCFLNFLLSSLLLASCLASFLFLFSRSGRPTPPLSSNDCIKNRAFVACDNLIIEPKSSPILLNIFIPNQINKTLSKLFTAHFKPSITISGTPSFLRNPPKKSAAIFLILSLSIPIANKANFRKSLEAFSITSSGLETEAGTNIDSLEASILLYSPALSIPSIRNRFSFSSSV